MLPDVDGEEALDAACHRGVGVAGGNDIELAIFLDQPRPARAELAIRGGGELVAERVVAAEIFLQRLAHSGRRLRGLGRKRLPVKVVVPSLARVVEELA